MNFPSTQLLLSRDVVAYDVEATGVSFLKDRMFSASLSWFDDHGQVQSWYGDLRDPGVLPWFRDHMPRIKKVVNHYMKYDMHMSREARIALPRTECTLVRETLLDEDKYDYGLERLSHKYLGHGKDDI